MTADQKLARLEDALSVEAKLLDRHERMDEERHARPNEKLDTLVTVVQGMAEDQLTTRAALATLIQHIDRFNQGRSGNGGWK